MKTIEAKSVRVTFQGEEIKPLEDHKFLTQRELHDAEVKRERELMQSLSDLFEQATGQPIDLTAWGLDQLMRVLKNPEALLILTRALDLGVHQLAMYGGGTRADLDARAAVIGPQEQVEQARRGIGSGGVFIGADFTHLEARTLRQAAKVANFGTYPAPRGGETWSNRFAAELLRMRPEDLSMPRQRAPLFVIDTDPDRGDAMWFAFAGLPIANPAAVLGSSLHSLLMSTLDTPAPRIVSLQHDQIVVDIPKRAAKRFNQRHTENAPRNPMPPASPFKRSRR